MYYLTYDSEKKTEKMFSRTHVWGREGGSDYKSTLAYSEGGRVKNSDFFAYVLNERSLMIVNTVHTFDASLAMDTMDTVYVFL